MSNTLGTEWFTEMFLVLRTVVGWYGVYGVRKEGL